jgi:hypothetical protein
LLIIVLLVVLAILAGIYIPQWTSWLLIDSLIWINIVKIYEDYNHLILR